MDCQYVDKAILFLKAISRLVKALHDAFGLYGRPKAWNWNPRNPISLMHGYPAGRFRVMLSIELHPLPFLPGFLTSRFQSLFLDRKIAEEMWFGEERTSYVRAELTKLLQQQIRAPIQNVQNKVTSQTADGRGGSISRPQRSSNTITHGRCNSAGPTRLQGEAGPSSSVPRSEQERQGKEFVQRDDVPEAELTRMISKLVICSFSQVWRYKIMI